MTLDSGHLKKSRSHFTDLLVLCAQIEKKRFYLGCTTHLPIISVVRIHVALRFEP